MGSANGAVSADNRLLCIVIMDIGYNGTKEIDSSPKKTKTPDGSRDFSDLPDQILVHILSLLPIKDALNTILLRSFGDLWRRIQVLDFDSCLYHDCDDPDYLPDYLNESFVNVIRYVLSHHDVSTLDKLSLSFGFAFTYSRDESLGDGFDDHKRWEKGTAVQIEKLIRYAISRKVKVLDLDLRGCTYADPREFYDLPDVLGSNYLTYLKLTAFDIRSCKTIDLKSLSVLVLHDVLLSDATMKEVLSGCPSLENLSLINCYGQRNFSCTNHKLKKVTLYLRAWDGLFIYCPYVVSLEINGSIDRVLILDASSAVDASICFSCLFRCAQRAYDEVSKLLQKLSRCQAFKLCTWTILVLTIWNFTNLPCPTFEWKNLTLKLSLTKWHHPGLSLLFRNCPSLETLTMCISPSSYYIFTRAEAQWIQAYDFDGEKYWDSQEAMFPYLKTIMIYGSIDQLYVIQMVKFLLKSSPSLQVLLISSKETSDHTRGRFKSLPRASPEANIHFS